MKRGSRPESEQDVTTSTLNPLRRRLQVRRLPVTSLVHESDRMDRTWNRCKPNYA